MYPHPSKGFILLVQRTYQEYESKDGIQSV